MQQLDERALRRTQFIRAFNLACKSPACLSNRQRGILKGLAEGLQVKDLAVKLDLSVKTIEAHKSGLYRKLGIHHLAEAIRYAYAHGIAETPKPKDDA